ncbi:hypothetical protein [Candidatus Pyrohabitans sp.]
MKCCGTPEKKKEGREVEGEKHEHGKEGHSSHAGCGMHGGGLLQYLMIGILIYLVVAYLF